MSEPADTALAGQESSFLGSFPQSGRLNRTSFNISDFREKLNKVVRPNLFNVRFLSLPSILKRASYNISDLEKFEFRCERAEIPGKSIATVDDIGSGTSLKLPYDVTYNDIQLTIICSVDMYERRFFESWIDETVGNRGDYGGMIRYYDEFAADSNIQITQSDSNGEMLLCYVLYDAFPIQLSPMTLAWEETNTYQRFTVTMSYRNHIMTYPAPIY